MTAAARPTTIAPATTVGAVSWRLARTRRLLLAVVPLTAALGLAGCGAQADMAATAPKQAAAAADAAVIAPAAPAERTGRWLGGPEPVSGKLRSGITSWWRLVPAQPRAGEPFQVLLRLEDVQADGASASVTSSDGARLTDTAAPPTWRLPAGRPAQISLQVVAPAGDSYLHVATRQRGRSSVRSILLSLPAATGAGVEAGPD